ncbi:MAG: hypothetical protein HKM07_05825 [Chlamydiae bacterium]|nr:hypothetical protein [Chlamydiota bacterium]
MAIITAFDPSQATAQPVQLVNLKKENSVVVIFPQGIQGTAEFTEDYEHIANSMRKIGIPVPKDQKEVYGLKPDRVAIRLADPKFGIAFFQIYYKNSMDPDVFQWQKV